MKTNHINRTPMAVSADIVVQDTGKELLVYNLKTHQAKCLNETVAAVWQVCDGKRGVGEIRAAASRKMQSLLTDEIVALAIFELDQNALLIEAPVVAADPAFSRREMVRRIGVTTAIALPVVTGIVAPKSISAASGGGGKPINASCNTDNECASVCCDGGTCQDASVCSI